MQEVIKILRDGGHVIVRKTYKRGARGGMSLDTELSSRPVGLMAIGRAELAGLIRATNPTPIRKGVKWEYKLVELQHENGAGTSVTAP